MTGHQVCARGWCILREIGTFAEEDSRFHKDASFGARTCFMPCTGKIGKPEARRSWDVGSTDFQPPRDLPRPRFEGFGQAPEIRTGAWVCVHQKHGSGALNTRATARYCDFYENGDHCSGLSRGSGNARGSNHFAGERASVVVVTDSQSLPADAVCLGVGTVVGEGKADAKERKTCFACTRAQYSQVVGVGAGRMK